MDIPLRITLFAILTSALVVSPAPAREKPNLILIMADDVGIEAFSTYGGEDYKTPRIDQMAAQGMQFDHCYSQPICTPSRVKLMTGQSNIRNYRAFSILDPTQTTFGHLLKKAGYKTAIAGKWQLYGAKHYGKLAATGMLPKKAGFDSWCLWQIDNLGSRYHNPLIIENGKELKNTENKYGPDLFSDFALRFIRENKDRPFFLYYPMVLVHDPFVPTPDSVGTDKGKKEKGRKNKKLAKKKNFTAMMSYMDKLVGKIIDEVKANGLEKDTLIIFMADNGTNIQITSRWCGEMTRGGKGLPTDAGTHVPMYACWPGKITPKSTNNTIIEFSDFLPTFLDLAGAKHPADLTMDGSSFLPALMGETMPDRDPIFMYSNPRPTRKKFPRHTFARNREWKLYRDGRLYHISKDRLEKHPIANDSPQNPEEVRALLQKKIDSMPTTGQNLAK